MSERLKRDFSTKGQLKSMARVALVSSLALSGCEWISGPSQSATKPQTQPGVSVPSKVEGQAAATVTVPQKAEGAPTPTILVPAKVDATRAITPTVVVARGAAVPTPVPVEVNPQTGKGGEAQTPPAPQRPRTGVVGTPAEVALVDIVIQPGQSIKVETDCYPAMVKGDIQVILPENNQLKGKPVYDNDGKTGAITQITGSATIYAPNFGNDKDGNPRGGANLTCGVTEAVIMDFLPHNLGLMFERGCEGGCEVVHRYLFDGSKLTRVADHKRGEVAIPTPVVTQPSPVAGGKVDIQPGCDVEITKGQTVDAEAGSVIQGDATIDGTEMNDNDSKTGLITVLNGNARVLARWGGLDIAGCFSSVEHRTAYIKKVRAEMLQTGCEKGCTRVNVLAYPGAKQGIQKDILD